MHACMRFVFTLLWDGWMDNTNSHGDSMATVRHHIYNFLVDIQDSYRGHDDGDEVWILCPRVK